MNKTAKGALAAGTAAVLLMGGAGTLAYWTDSVEGGAGTVNSGELTITPGAAGAWTHNGTAVDNPQAVDAVPGDTFVYSGATYTIGADGEDLSASLTVNAAGLSTTGTFPAGAVTVDSDFTLEGSPLASSATITENNEADVVGVTITVDFPFGTEADNNSQLKTVDLTEYVVTLTQTDV